MIELLAVLVSAAASATGLSVIVAKLRDSLGRKSPSEQAASIEPASLDRLTALVDEIHAEAEEQQAIAQKSAAEAQEWHEKANAARALASINEEQRAEIVAAIEGATKEPLAGRLAWSIGPMIGSALLGVLFTLLIVGDSSDGLEGANAKIDVLEDENKRLQRELDDTEMQLIDIASRSSESLPESSESVDLVADEGGVDGEVDELDIAVDAVIPCSETLEASVSGCSVQVSRSTPFVQLWSGSVRISVIDVKPGGEATFTITDGPAGADSRVSDAVIGERVFFGSDCELLATVIKSSSVGDVVDLFVELNPRTSGESSACPPEQ